MKIYYTVSEEIAATNGDDVPIIGLCASVWVLNPLNEVLLLRDAKRLGFEAVRIEKTNQVADPVVIEWPKQ